MRKTAIGAPGRPNKQVATTTCAATGCQAVINVPLLMCVHHWRLVPAALQRQVWAAYRRLGREPGAREVHLKAVAAAVDALHTKQLARKGKADKATGSLF
jgi:hypothetical protein